MSYNTQSQNKTTNNIVELVVFRTGPNNYIYTSTHSEPLVIGGNTYLPFPFNRGERKISNAFEDDGVKIVVMPDHPICAHYRTMPTDYDVSCIIRQGYLDDSGNPTGALDTDYPILALGWIGAYEFDTDSGEATLSVVTVGDTLSAPSLNRNFQQSCPLRLYGPKCKATRKFVTISPTTITGGVVSLAAGWNGTYDLIDFTGGLISFIPASGPTQYRMVAQARATTLVFVGSSDGLDEYPTIQLALGCPHTLDGCLDLHDNSRRYGGFPYQPLDNPVNKSIR